MLYCIFIDKAAGKRKLKQAGILVQGGLNFKRCFLEIVGMVDIDQDNRHVISYFKKILHCIVSHSLL